MVLNKIDYDRIHFEVLESGQYYSDFEKYTEKQHAGMIAMLERIHKGATIKSCFTGGASSKWLPGTNSPCSVLMSGIFRPCSSRPSWAVLKVVYVYQKRYALPLFLCEGFQKNRVYAAPGQ